jgi:outer membrane protein insertion porin family
VFFSSSFASFFRFFVSWLVLGAWLYGQGSLGHKAAAAGTSRSWKLVSVDVKGSQRYTPEQIQAQCGLQTGQPVSEEDFRKVSQRLGETGVFSNVSYGFSYSLAGVKLELQVSDSEQWVPARFDNFVWFSDQDLMGQLRERVPLFTGMLPASGDLADEVSDALQAMLIEHKIAGKADYIREAPMNGPIASFLFSVTAHKILIRNVEFSGAGPGELALLREESRRLAGSEYRQSIVQNEEKLGFRPIYLKHGYLKAEFEETGVKIAQDGDDQTLVDLSIRALPGIQYKLAEISWSGNTEFSSSQLQALIHLKTGEPADAVQLDEDLRAAARLYGTRGRMAPSLVPTPEMDDASATVRYAIVVQEGEIYRMGDLEIRGLDEKSKGRMRFDWKLGESEIYDSSYLERFLAESRKDLPSGAQWKVIPHEAINDDQTVDITLTYQTQ